METGQTHWSEQKEAAAGYWPLKCMLILFRVVPAFLLRLMVFPVSLVYYLISKNVRDESERFLRKIAHNSYRPGMTLKHILSFALALVEKVESWSGKIAFSRIHFQGDDVGDLVDRLENGEGALLICSHLGNAELLRGLAHFHRTGVSRDTPVTSIVDFSGTAHFNRMLQEVNPDSMMHIVSANAINPGTIIDLSERAATGELVVIAGDRTSAHTRDTYIALPFLGTTAPFPYGAFFLAALLNAPTYFVFALRQKDISFSPEYHMYVHKSCVDFDCPRKERYARIQKLAENFAEKLETYCKQHPYQWYNFYDFWAKPEHSVEKKQQKPEAANGSA